MEMWRSAASFSKEKLSWGVMNCIFFCAFLDHCAFYALIRSPRVGLTETAPTPLPEITQSIHKCLSDQWHDCLVIISRVWPKRQWCSWKSAGHKWIHFQRISTRYPGQVTQHDCDSVEEKGELRQNFGSKTSSKMDDFDETQESRTLFPSGRKMKRNVGGKSEEKCLFPSVKNTTLWLYPTMYCNCPFHSRHCLFNLFRNGPSLLLWFRDMGLWGAAGCECS